MMYISQNLMVARDLTEAGIEADWIAADGANKDDARRLAGETCDRRGGVHNASTG